MITHESIIVADAVADKLKAQGYLEAQRRLCVTFKLSSFKDRKITVVPVGFEMEPESRCSDKTTVLIQIGIQQLIAGKDPDAEIAALMEVERDIVRKFNRLTGLSTLGGKVIAIDNNPVFDGLAIQESNLFIGIITLTVQLSTPAEAHQ